MSSVPHSRPLTEVVSDIKHEIKDIAQTRFELLKIELKEKSALLKVAGILGIVAVLLLGTAYVLFTLALVGLVAAAFINSPYHWVLGFLIVGAAWLVLGGIAGFFAMRQFQKKGMLPTRTLQVLKGDKIWLQSEARNQL